MSDAPTPGPSKAIISFTKKPELTRQGTQKLKFTPTLPVRRKKEEVKAEPAVHDNHIPTGDRGRGRGRGRGESRGRGDGRGRGNAPRPPVEMTASGPFAMGPALAGNNAKRVAPRSNFVPIPGSSASAALGAGLSRTAAPSLKREIPDDAQVDEDAYSDPDDGVQIVDMENVRQMDWMAPESLAKDRRTTKKKNKIKAEETAKSKGKAKAGAMDVDAVEDEADVNLANALNLSDSEEEEELEDLIDDFALGANIEPESDIRQERLYFFQFPAPFPTFVSNLPTGEDMETEQESNAKKVSFAPGTKQAAPAPEPEKQIPKVDGIIGQMEIYKSGAVKMRLANGILLDVTAATQPSFLQQAVYLDMANKKLNVVGEVNKRFVVSPNVDSLIAAMDFADKMPSAMMEGEEGLIQMDTD